MKQMKNIWNIYKLDLKNIVTNFVVAILIGGLVILPSLYAWLNIKASWDPYAQTDQIPIGVVNEDVGAVIRDKQVNVGDELVETLKENTDFNWNFVNRQTAIDEVEYGNYYAVIVVPSNFSETLGTVITDQPTKAEIEYYVNEKINAIAPKITDKGASVIVEQISSQFISTVNGIIFEMFNDIGIEIEANLPDIQQFEQYIFTLEKELPSIHKLLTETKDDSNKADDIINKANKLLPEAKDIVSTGIGTVDRTIALLDEAEQRLHNLAPKINDDLETIQSTFSNIQKLLGELDQHNVNEQIEKINRLNEQLNDSIQYLEEMENTLQQIQDNMEQESTDIQYIIEEIGVLKELFTAMQGDLSSISKFLTNNEQSINNKLEQLEDTITTTNLNEFIKTYKEKIEPTVLNEVAKGKKKVNQAKNMLNEISATIPEIERLLVSTSTHLHEGQGMLDSVLNQFPYVNDKVKEVANEIRRIQSEADVHDIIQLLQNDPEKERGFFAEPVVLNKNEVFPIPNYGTGMTPFYTVLALWVGALLLISLLSTEVPDVPNLHSREMYTGRFLTFMTIGLLQTFIVTSGDMLLVGVQVSSPMWFILFGLFISFIFMTIVYTVVSVFGDVGKAIAIVLLVLQISSSGGTYPVVLLPGFFSAINPFLAFTYAVDLMREAVGGIIWGRALKDILILLLFGCIFITGGIFLKGPINKQMNKLMKSKDSRLFH